MTIVRQSRESDIPEVAANMRHDDTIEVIAQSYASPREALEKSYEYSTVRFTLEKDGKAIAMFGLCPDTILGDKAGIWLLGTSEIATVKKSFCRFSLKVIKYFLSQYPILTAQVDSRYEKAHRWLKWMGATKGKPYKLIGGVEFNDFSFMRGA
jgi:hypothetical protein